MLRSEMHCHQGWKDLEVLQSSVLLTGMLESAF